MPGKARSKHVAPEGCSLARPMTLPVPGRGSCQKSLLRHNVGSCRRHFAGCAPGRTHMQLLRTFARAAGTVAILLSTTALAQAVDVSFLTHRGPDTVAKLAAAIAVYSKDHPDTKITVRAVPFGDLLTTLRSSGGGADGATIAGIYDAWLPDLAKDKLVAPVPDAIAADTKANWPAGIVGAASIDGTLYGIPNEIDVYALNYN